MLTDDGLPILERPFLDKLLCIHVTRDAPAFPLAEFAAFICGQSRGQVVKKLGAPWIDEAYWDIQVEDSLLVLHYQHVLGVFLCAGTAEAEPLVERLFPVVEEYVRRSRKAQPGHR